MNNSFQKNILTLGRAVFIGGMALLGLWRGYHFLTQDVPLGYDPGLYKKMFESYSQLLPYLELSSLPERIQRMYPPFLGTWGAILDLFGVVGSEGFVTRGIVFLSLLVCLGVYFFCKRKHGVFAISSMLFVRLSFANYQLFWWNYMKQLLGLFFVLILFGLVVRKKWILVVPLFCSLVLTHRPGAMFFVGGMVVYYLVSLLYNRSFSGTYLKLLKEYLFAGGLFVLGGVFSLPIYAPLLDAQILTFLPRVVKTISLPQVESAVQAGYQAGGTFLTVLDYWNLHWYAILGLVLYLVCRVVVNIFPATQRKYSEFDLLLFSVTCLGGFWIFGKWIFFQRMIGYVDVFVMIGLSSMITILYDYRKYLGVFVGVFCLGYHAWTFGFWVERTWRPIIGANEFSTIQKLGTEVNQNDLVVVPGIWYTPWVIGRTDAHVLAPGNISKANSWGTLTKDRQKKRYLATSAEKCFWLEEDYGYFTGNMYLWQGLKQSPTEVDDKDCFTRKYSSSQEYRSLWEVSFEKGTGKIGSPFEEKESE